MFLWLVDSNHVFTKQLHKFLPTKPMETSHNVTRFHTTMHAVGKAVTLPSTGDGNRIPFQSVTDREKKLKDKNHFPDGNNTIVCQQHYKDLASMKLSTFFFF